VSVCLIRAGVVSVLTAAGAKNVSAEETYSLDFDEAFAARVYGDRVHFWIVRMSRIAGIGGAGYIDRRHRVTVEGFIGVSRDAPADGAVSDRTVATLWDAIVAAIEDPDNAHAGGAIDFEGETPDPITLTTIRIGQQKIPVHRMRLTATYTEAN